MKPPYETKILQNSNYTIQLFLDYFNERLRVDDYRGNLDRIVEELDLIMNNNSFTKLIFYSKSEHWRQLLCKGFELEGIINGFFNGSDNYIMTTYKKNERRSTEHWIKENNILASIKTNKKSLGINKIVSNYIYRKANSKDAKSLAGLYEKVFSIYPTPMNNSEYVEKMIKQGTIFYVVEGDKELVSAASVDINSKWHNAELTDCATLPDHRKNGLMKYLLSLLEKELKDQEIYCAYSLARALSYGMNASLFQLGYQYTGRLTNNCYIFDKLENMNVWVKDLRLSTSE
ncbi:putative beta-lysine N-acetyltransferase [Calidifontibacillus oryziterrae]|uniref:putative beta-lysine N-acetyltransferase n=1 Tax=Calidifontibacillus oryziterrae TaxID=1191699 RepID=UPI0003040EF5|nr:putative beta-lysine N-acetyltransferase [Calidifontibacillus oryziterrae]